MLLELAQMEGDGAFFVRAITTGSIVSVLGLLLWLAMKGTIRFSPEHTELQATHAREMARLEKEIEWRDKNLVERTADRDKWIASFLQGLEVAQKQSEAIGRLKDTVEDLARVVEKLADEIRKGPGKG